MEGPKVARISNNEVSTTTTPGEIIEAATREMDEAYKSNNMPAFYEARERVIQLFITHGYTK